MKRLKADCLLKVLDHNAQLREILARGDELQLPNWYVGAGFVAQTYWNRRHGFHLLQHIKDIDIAYFDDTDLSEASEHDHECRIQSLFPKVPLKFDVKNQARVHLWYAQRFGKSITPYRSTEDAINSWPTTATCVGIRSNGLELHLCAPFGLEDLLEMIVRPMSFPGFPGHPARRVSSGLDHGKQDASKAKETHRRV